MPASAPLAPQRGEVRRGEASSNGAEAAPSPQRRKDSASSSPTSLPAERGVRGGLLTQAYPRERHLLWALCHLLLMTEILQSPFFFAGDTSAVYTRLPQTLAKAAPADLVLEHSPAQVFPCQGPALWHSSKTTDAVSPRTHLGFASGKGRDPSGRQVCHPCKDRLGNAIVGPLEALLSKRGTEPPDDALGGFLGGSPCTQEDEMQRWWGARVQAGLAREVLGTGRAEGLQGRRRELHQQSFKVQYRIKY